MLPGRGKYFTDEENKRYYEQIDAIERYVDPTASYANFIEGHEPNVKIQNCGFGGLSIASNGNVYFCNRIHEVDCFGNVNKEKLIDLLQQGQKVLETTSVENVSNCHNCMLRYISCVVVIVELTTSILRVTSKTGNQTSFKQNVLRNLKIAS